MSLTFERIEALAPDQASLAAARKEKGLLGANAKDLAQLRIAW
jgi:hypothetical protein